MLQMTTMTLTQNQKDLSLAVAIGMAIYERGKIKLNSSGNDTSLESEIIKSAQDVFDETECQDIVSVEDLKDALRDLVNQIQYPQRNLTDKDGQMIARPDTTRATDILQRI